MEPFDEQLETFAASDWGKATTTQTGAAGLCLRATLAFLAQLERAGLRDDVVLWHLEGAVGERGRGDDGYGTHWVLVRRGEVIDVSSRQFDPRGPHIRRCPADDEFARWHHCRAVDPDDKSLWNDPFLRARIIHPDWRLLLDTGPPGDLPEWPYPRDLLDEDSPWYRRCDRDVAD